MLKYPAPLAAYALPQLMLLYHVCIYIAVISLRCNLSLSLSVLVPFYIKLLFMCVSRPAYTLLTFPLSNADSHTHTRTRIQRTKAPTQSSACSELPTGCPLVSCWTSMARCRTHAVVIAGVTSLQRRACCPTKTPRCVALVQHTRMNRCSALWCVIPAPVIGWCSGCTSAPSSPTYSRTVRSTPARRQCSCRCTRARVRPTVRR
jgi:hypothetical protein